MINRKFRLLAHWLWLIRDQFKVIHTGWMADNSAKALPWIRLQRRIIGPRWALRLLRHSSDHPNALPLWLMRLILSKANCRIENRDATPMMHLHRNN